MSAKASLARAAGRACSWGLRTLAHRKASTLPGRVALAVDSDLIADLAPKCAKGSIVICGTNGKTTTTNVVARALQDAGERVLCNWDGANMATGVATALLPGHGCDWGVFENDELSTPSIVPGLRPRVLVLLNLFRDQLDRTGEIDRVQDVIVRAVSASPETTLVYNGDDPLCEGVARRVRAAGNRTLSFGIEAPMGLAADRVRGGAFCQVCGAPLRYAWRQYGQLGSYACTRCDFARLVPDFSARDVSVSLAGVSFTAQGPGGAATRVAAGWGGPYMVYNLLAAFAAVSLAGVDPSRLSETLASYAPANGRLQTFCVGGRHVTLNLAKNPTGFNQNISLLAMDPAPKVVLIMINDDYNDGKDVSWLWDVDFERLREELPDDELAGRLVCLVGGHRANDMQVRMKYAGVSARIVGSVGEALELTSGLAQEWTMYVLTNYSALWPAKAELERLEATA